MSTGKAPLVILGMEAGDENLIQQWAKEGYLPTLRRIIGEGCRATFSGPELLTSHGVGISIFSGVSRFHHRYYDVRELRPNTYNVEACGQDRAEAVPFWAHLKNSGKRVCIIDVFETLVQPDLDGVQLCCWTSHQSPLAPLPPGSSPTGLVSEFVEEFGRPFHAADFVENVTKQREYDDHRRLLDAVAKKGEICRRLIKKGEYDLSVIMFSDMHQACHRFWRYRSEARGDSASPGDPILTNAIRDVYQAIDRELGSLLELLPDDANIFFVGMYGMEEYYPITELCDRFCRMLGYQASPGPGKISYDPLMLAKRVIPLPLRRLLGRMAGTASNERVLTAQFRTGTDWERTTVYALPNLFDGHFRVNLRGRDPNGVVEPGKEYLEVLEQLEADLSNLVDPVTDAPAVDRMSRCVDLFGDVSDVLPDLFVEFKPHSHFLHRLIHPRGEITQRQPGYFRDTNHTRSGTFWAMGPSIQTSVSLGEVDPLDLAPTFLSLLGEAAPDCMKGSVLRSLLTSETECNPCVLS